MTRNLGAVLFSFFFVSSFVFSAHADFNGVWTASTGAAAGSVQANCDPIQIKVDQTASELIVEQDSYTCGDITVDPLTLQFSIQNGNLFLEGQICGTIDTQNAEYVMPGQQGSYYSLKMQLAGKQMAYDLSMGIGEFGTEQVKAELKRQ
jgi:hypothetical protein